MRPTRRSHEGRVVMKVIAKTRVSRWYVQENRVSSLGVRSAELAKSPTPLRGVGEGKGLTKHTFDTLRNFYRDLG